MLSEVLNKIRKTAIDIVDYSEPNTPNIGLVGLLGFPALYVCLQYVVPQKYNGFIWYLFGILFVLPQVFYGYFPSSFKRVYPIYFFVGGFYTLPFFSFFMFLKNDTSIIWLLSCLGCLLFFIIIFYDWLIVTLMIIAAYGLATLLVALLDGRLPPLHTQLSYLPIFLISYVGALFLNHRKQASQESKISLMKSLSGMIAHEMRNPLNTINLAMENIQSTLPARPAVDRKPDNFMLSYDELVGIHDVIVESITTVKTGNRMIDSILSNLREGDVDKSCFRRYSIRSVVMMALNTYSFRNQHEKRLIFTEICDNFDFFGDKEQFVYVLFNLINNALCYSRDEDFRIEIRAESIGGVNILRIRDTGPGVPVELRERIFNRFFTEGKRNGNGLGLFFCRRVVESFSGTIICDSEVHRWTEFVITLPKYDSRAVEATKKQILASKHVLVVDDDVINRTLHMKLLAELGCRSDQAENGRQALDMATNKRYDMILMDIEMPGLNGDETVRLMRSGSGGMKPSMMLHYRGAAIIGVTALPEREVLNRTLLAGMNEFVMKPLRKSELLRMVEKYFFNDQEGGDKEIGDRLAGARIIVADDNAATRKFLSIVLENEGCVTTMAENGAQVIELLEHTDFDLVLMDMAMPVLDGVAAVRNIRDGSCFKRFRGYGRIPVIAVTGYGEQEDLRRSLDAGMNAHIGKPVSKQDLVRTVSFWLDRMGRDEKEPDRLGMASDKVVPGSGSTSASIESSETTLARPVIEELGKLGGSALMKQMLELFRHNVSANISELERAEAERDIALACRATHSLKGVAAQIGAEKLQRFAGLVNDAMRQGRWPEDREWVAKMRFLFEDACGVYESYLVDRAGE
jgi:two-component system CAI-1 autoinducer sensor kinase/phosphatase CqsS